MKKIVKLSLFLFVLFTFKDLLLSTELQHQYDRESKKESLSKFLTEYELSEPLDLVGGKITHICVDENNTIISVGVTERSKYGGSKVIHYLIANGTKTEEILFVRYNNFVVKGKRGEKIVYSGIDYNEKLTSKKDTVKKKKVAK